MPGRKESGSSESSSPGTKNSAVDTAAGGSGAKFFGFDDHHESVQTAAERACQAGLNGRVRFAVGSAKDYNGGPYDLVTVFDALHDMGDPAGAARHVLRTLKPDRTWMIVEPKAGDTVAENLNPIGRAFYSASTMICTPCSLAQEAGPALGAQAHEARIREVVMAAGFTRFRRAAETPINLVFEARP